MNMKKVGIFIFTVIAFLTASAVCYAQDGSAEIPDLSSRIQGHALELQYGYIDPTDGQHWKLRIPMRPAPTLYVYQSNRKLYFAGNESTTYDLQIYQENSDDEYVLMYSCEVPSGTASLELPIEIPAGNYLIRFVSNVMFYYGDIEL
jgi:hypothetical protein